MKAMTLAEAKSKEKQRPMVFKVPSRERLKNGGKYHFKTLSSKYNPQSEVLSLKGIPYKINKSGEIVEYERITLCIDTAYYREDGVAPIVELLQCFEIEPDSEVADNFFVGKNFISDICINEYQDEDGNIISTFYNAESFEKLN